MVIILSAVLCTGGYAPAALAGLIGAGDFSPTVEATTASTRHAVSERLLELGVSDKQVHERLAALNSAELRLLEQQLDELPAGAGALEIIGIVFLVLLILELVGITNIFNKI